jgi:hypothetical protein
LRRDIAGGANGDREDEERISRRGDSPQRGLFAQNFFERLRHAVKKPQSLTLGVDGLERGKHQSIGGEGEGDRGKVLRMIDRADENIAFHIDEDLRAHHDDGEQKRLRHEGAIAAEKAQLAPLHSREQPPSSRGRRSPPRSRRANNGFSRARGDDAEAQLA